jgi:hypothetical protein
VKTAAHIESTPSFDWLMAILALLQIGGVAQDGWAHAHGQVDQSFLTPWHAMLYGATALTGIVLLVAGIRGLQRGYPARFALPFGYWTAAIGVVLFIVGGLFDFAWHTIFGIEVDLAQLVSPSHLFLAIAAAVIFSGPLRSIAHQYGPQVGGWRQIGPAVLATFAFLALIGFFTQYVQPLADDGIFRAISRGDNDSPVGSIVRIDPRTGQQSRLTSGRDAFGAAVSPDGTHVVYRVDRPAPSAASDLFVARADGSQAVQITNSGRHDTQPAWSPDGKWIAYSSQPAGTSGNFTIAVIAPQTKVSRTLVNGVTTVESPAWSGSAHVIYSSRNGVTPELASVPINGGQPTWLVASARGNSPAVAADGRLAFVRDGSIVVAAADGSGAKMVIPAGDQPAWSADGKHIAYVYDDGSSSQIFVANADGSQPQDVTKLSGLDAARPAWSPNGSIYAYVVGRSRTGGLASVRALAAFMLQAVVVVGLLLLLVLRWRAPTGAITVVLTLFGIAMWAQSDLTPWIIAAPIAVGIITDVALGLFYDRIRATWWLYALAAKIGGLLAAFYLIIAWLSGTYHWEPDLTLGAPIIAAIAGLLVAYCYRLPLPDASTST